MSDETETVWEQGDQGAVTITMKAGKDYGVPWIVLRYKSVVEALEGLQKSDGADVMQLLKEVSGASKAFTRTYENREAPAARTQGKPEGADRPSPQVEKEVDIFAAEDDAPPFAQPDDTPTCKHGPRLKKPYKEQVYWVCSADLPKDSPERCKPEIR